jgi:hypothetical protein
MNVRYRWLQAPATNFICSADARLRPGVLPCWHSSRMPASSPWISIRSSSPSGTSTILSSSERISSNASSRIALVRQRPGQRGYLLPVDLGQVGMQERLRRLGRGGELGLQLLLPGLQREQLVFQGARGHAVRDHLHDPPEPSLDLGQVAPQAVAPGVPIPRIRLVSRTYSAQNCRNSSGSMRLCRKASRTVSSSRSRRMFLRLGADGGALVAGGSAAEQVGADLGVAPAACAADDQPREQVAGAAPVARAGADVGPGVAAHGLLAHLDAVPEVLVDDPQPRDLPAAG